MAGQIYEEENQKQLNVSNNSVVRNKYVLTSFAVLKLLLSLLSFWGKHSEPIEVRIRSEKLVRTKLFLSSHKKNWYQIGAKSKKEKKLLVYHLRGNVYYSLWITSYFFILFVSCSFLPDFFPAGDLIRCFRRYSFSAFFGAPTSSPIYILFAMRIKRKRISSCRNLKNPLRDNKQVRGDSKLGPLLEWVYDSRGGKKEEKKKEGQ